MVCLMEHTGKGRLIMIKTQNLQDVFLNQARKAETPLTVFLVNGFQMRGTVSGFDSFTVVLDTEGKQQLIYKHAISTIIPARAVRFPEKEKEKESVPV